MFQSTRIKLTGWYLMIIMVISILFSIIIYFLISQELDRGYRRIALRYQIRRELIPPESIPEFLESGALDFAKERVRNQLLYINFVIFLVSGLSGYFLAGRTLKPIQLMIDEQNRFITDASHELRTPLTSLRSEIEVNLRDKKMKLPQARTILASNLEEVITLQNLSDNLLKLAQFQKTYDLQVSEKISISEVIKDAVKKVQPIAKTKNITIENKIRDFQLKGYRQGLIELFVIFLDNALKYSQPDKEVSIYSQVNDAYNIVHIADQGIGIEEKDLPHIFDRFYRTDWSRAKINIAGYGLGLSIAKKIVDNHKGYIKVKSRVDKGTVFSLYFPK